MKKKNSICCVAGKSGGHIIPCLTLAEKKLRDHPNTHIVFFITESSFDRAIIASSHLNITTITLPFGTHSFNRFRRVMVGCVQFVSSFFKSLWYLFRFRPLTVISTGGAVSLPVAYAAHLMRIPIELYELNALPGKAARTISQWCKPTVYTVFPHAQPHFNTPCVKTTYPIVQKPILEKQAARHKLALKTDIPIILILGGSQGSQLLNQYMIHIAPKLSCFMPFHVIHQTGNFDSYLLHEAYTHAGIVAHVFDYSQDIFSYYAAADLIIARAGSGTLWEIVHFNKKALIIPLESQTTTHQLYNAQAIAEQYPELFTVINEKHIKTHSDTLVTHIHSILNNQPTHL